MKALRGILLFALLLRPVGGEAQAFPRCWSFALPGEPSAAFPSIRLLDGGEALLFQGSGTAAWSLRADTVVAASGSGSQSWTLAILPGAAIPSAVLRHGRDDPHPDPEPPIDLRAVPISCDELDGSSEEAKYDSAPHLQNADEVDAALRRRSPGEFRVRRSALVRFRVAPDGRVLARRIEQTSGVVELDEAAVAIGEVARFDPATLEGRSVEAWVALWFHFR